MRASTRRDLLIAACLGLAACNSQDWRAQAIANAEDKVRVEVNNPSAEFSRVQVTGNSSTGQSCGFVTVKYGPRSPAKTGRFIVYIDGTAGPYVEPDMAMNQISQDKFDFAWRYDCLKEGYKS